MLGRLAGTIYLHQLDSVTRSDLHDVALLGSGQGLGKLTREGRERHYTHLAAVGCRHVIDRILRSGLCEVGTAAQGGQQAVSQRILGIGEHDVADAHRVGNHLRIKGTGHRPLVVLQHGAIGLAGHQRGSLLLGELGGRNVVVGDLAVAVGADERLQLVRCRELLAHLRSGLLDSQQVIVRGSHLEDHVRDRTGRRLTEHVLVAVVVGLHLRRRNADDRVGNRRILLAGPFARIGLVGRLHAAGHLEGIDVDTAADQTEVLLHLTLGTGLLVELGPGLCSLRIGLGLCKEIGDCSYVVGPRTRIGKSVVERLRGLLAADHRHTFGLGHTQTQTLETGRHHILRDERLPRGVGQHRSLLLVVLLNAALGLDLLVLVVILRIVDLLAVDHADARIIARETHLGLQ